MHTRRDFIKIGSLGLGATALTGGVANLVIGASSTKSTGTGLRKVPTYCEVCFWKCAGWAHVTPDNKIQKITGHADDPQCNGRLCPRGTGGVGMFSDPDRLKRPLIRVIKNGEQTYREASWEEALDFIATKMKEIAAKHGPESMALFNHGSSGKYFTHLLNAFGSNNVAAPSFAQCRGPRDTGFELTFGESVSSPEVTDIRDTRCLVLIGSHIGENMHNGQVQEMSEAIDKGAVIITVDPRLSTAASKSKFWLPIKPSTDLALLLAWIHVLIYDDIYNKEYVAKYAEGFNELRQHVKNFTPEWAYGITTIKPELICQTAREMANAAPSTIIHPGRHTTWYGDDVQRSRAIAILNALLGSWGNRGGIFFKEGIKIPDFPRPEYPKPAWSWQQTLNGRYPFAKEAVTNTIIEASIPAPGKEHMIRGWIVSGTNLIVAVPLQKQLMQAMQSLDLLVVVDTMPMEITGYADVVLPECTYLERHDDLRATPHREPTLALRMPAIEPLYDTKPAWWISKQLGERLGLGAYYNYKDFKEVLDWQLKQVGSSLKEMETIGLKKLPRKSPVYIEPGADYKFKTATGKIQLNSKELQEGGFDAMPVYKPHPQPEEGFYRLIYGRAPMHTFSRTANNRNLVALMPENSVWVNPQVAELWGLRKNQHVWLKNQDGVISNFSVKVRITERIRWDSVYIVHGFGHHHKPLTYAFGRGVNDTELITRVITDPVMGGTGMRGNFVTFLKTEPKKAKV
ncbi:MAG: molybdopterin-dependent oxidoreductase [Prolixibacteraceae bacterium]|jgi:thiosulfate reductase/polysulfide reductase chain A|nr:molybdopterin-dependent oxidoreductase [Prolixibacteraceae bacterium]